MYKVFLYSLIFVATVALFLRLAYEASAFEINEVIIDQQYYVGDTINARGDEFTGSGSGAQGVKFTAPDNFYMNIFSIAMCRVYDDLDPQWATASSAVMYARLETGGLNTVIATSTNSYNYESLTSCESATNVFMSFYFYDESSMLLASGTEYKIIIGSLSNADSDFIFEYEHNDVSTTTYPWVGNCDVSDCHSIDSSRWVNFTIQTTNDVGISWSDPVSWGVYDPNQNISYVNPKTCVLGSQCLWWYTYRSSHIGHTFYFIPYTNEAILDPSAYDVDSQDIESAVYPYDYFTLTATSSPGRQTYCLYDDDPTASSSDDNVICNIYVDWTEEVDVEWIFGEYDIESACDSVATSTGTFDDFRYGIECGFRKFVYWAIHPTESSITQFKNSTAELTNQFPFSIAYQFIDLATTTASSTANGIEVPLRWYNTQTKQYEDTGAYLLTTSTLSVGMGQTYDFYWEWSNRIVYLLCFLYLFSRILGIINPRFSAKFNIPFGDRMERVEDRSAEQAVQRRLTSDYSKKL